MPAHPPAAESLADFVRRHPSLFVLTGAGISTASGIPDYRDASGAWKHAPPIQFAAFVAERSSRQRYWARSLVGWPRVHAARPAAAHRVLARLEQQGHVGLLCTQNVDGLHQAAGSRNVIDLHGRLDTARCLACDHREPRAGLQLRLEALNPRWAARTAQARADGDADLDGDFSDFVVPPCPACGGILKPDVVFFGESVPGERVAAAMAAALRADAVLVIGSSLMVYSGYRFAAAAAAAGRPVAAVNRGRTRADSFLAMKVEMDIDEALTGLAQSLSRPGPGLRRRSAPPAN